MTTTKTPSTTPYTPLLGTLLSKEKHTFLSLPTSPHRPLLPSHSISSLQLHPTLEAALHLLNLDLASAHFLLRHSQAPPAYESMYLHGILHRIEGDIDNARAWYGDVEKYGRKGETEVLGEVWEGGDWREFLDRVERWKGKGGDEREKAELSEISLEELRKVLGVCERKFGTGEVLDASGEYTMNGDHGDMAANMVTGGEGWREF